MTFKVGYIEGQKNKMSIITADDIKAMYSRFKTGEITLWCDARVSEVGLGAGRCKRKREESSKQEREDEVEDILYQELKEKHANKFDIPKMRLWARMIASNIHCSMDDPPSIPAFGVTKKTRRESNSMTDALSGAAVAIVNALSNKENSNGLQKAAESTHKAHADTTSPGKIVELRRKYLEQLRYVQQLHKDDI